MGTVADDILELQRAFDDAEMRGDADRLDAGRGRARRDPAGPDPRRAPSRENSVINEPGKV
jgi:hypothetical protein